MKLPNKSTRRPAGRKALLLLLLVPFVVLLWPPLYNFRDPQLFGVPFFYWFQFAWIGVTAIITGVLYWLNIEFEPRDAREKGNGHL